MGLDMYLYGVCKDSENTGRWREVMYWRKANQIHYWFKKNFIKDGNPWGYYEVKPHELQTLKTLCFIVLEYRDSPDIAEILLPPNTLGCCFGSIEINGSYYDDIEETYKILTELLTSYDYDTFFYRASW